MRLVRWLRRLLDRYWPDERIVDLTHRLLESGRELNRLSDEAALTNRAVQARITGDCERHADMPMGEFLLRGGSECPLCLREQLDATARGSIPPSVSSVREDETP